MTKHFFAFFLIALASELGTSWLARYRSVSPDGDMVCFRSLESMIGNRLLIWAVFFLLLSVVWLALSRTRRTA